VSIATPAPLPGGREIAAAALGGAALDDAALARLWPQPGQSGRFFARASFALEAIVAARRTPVLFVPDYFCNAATIPARQAGARVVFYPIDEALTPSWAQIEQLAAAAKPELFLIAHYFGMPADVAAARRFCERHGAALIEDAAHALRPTAGIGRSGDYVLWSLYKHLPIPENGAPSIRWWAKRLLQRGAPALAAKLRRPPLPFERDPDPSPPEPSALSRAARRMIAACDLDRIAARRIAGERALRAELGLEPALPQSDGSWVPYRAVFRGDARDYDRLIAAGFPVETWPDLAPEVRADPARHAAALRLRNSLLPLPIDASVRALRRTARRAHRPR
jgi:hypothetical protein